MFIVHVSCDHLRAFRVPELDVLDTQAPRSTGTRQHNERYQEEERAGLEIP